VVLPQGKIDPVPDSARDFITNFPGEVPDVRAVVVSSSRAGGRYDLV
jgi:hypothetical protein